MKGNTGKPEFKMCTQCKTKKIFNAQFFVRASKEKFGLTSWCKECKKKESQERRRKQGAKPKKKWTIKEAIIIAEKIGKSKVSTCFPEETIITTRFELEFICNCGNEFKRTFSKFKDAKQYECNKCAHKRTIIKQRKPHDEFIKEVYELKGEEFIVIGHYVNYNTVVRIKHNECGKTFEMKPREFISQNQGCPLCRHKKSGLKRRTNPVEFHLKASFLLGEEYILLSKYTKRGEKLKVKHEVCGNIYETTPEVILAGGKCTNPVCLTVRIHEKRTTTHEEFVEIIQDIVDNEYNVIGKFNGYEYSVRMRHNKCGKEWMANPHHFKRGTRCPRCKTSYGERTIEEYLTTNRIPYMTQYRFEGCKYKRKLPFDFYLPKLNTVIEYDGVQHYKPSDFFGGEKAFEHRKKLDEIKNEFCKKNKINMIRVSYQVDDIHSYLEKKIKLII